MAPVHEDDEQGDRGARFLDEEDPSGDWIPEQVQEYFDASSHINDRLVQAKGWWALEVWPIKYRQQMKDSDAWEKKTGFNLGKFRAVQEPDPNMHWTVRHRMHDKRYEVRARVGRNALWRVVT